VLAGTVPIARLPTGLLHQVGPAKMLMPLTTQCIGSEHAMLDCVPHLERHAAVAPYLTSRIPMCKWQWLSPALVVGTRGRGTAGRRRLAPCVARVQEAFVGDARLGPEEHAARWRDVTPGAADHLRVRLQRARWTPVDDLRTSDRIENGRRLKKLFLFLLNLLQEAIAATVT
jgi:hypothetical protein